MTSEDPRYARMTDTDVQELFSGLSPFDLMTSLIAGRSALRALAELKARGITPEHVEQLENEMQNGVAMIKQIARERRVNLPDLEEVPLRASPRGMH